MRTVVVVLALGLAGAAGEDVAAPAQPQSSLASGLAAAASAANDSVWIWDGQMKSAGAALNQKSYALAERSCLDALKTTAKFGPTDLHLTTNLVYLAGIYQTEGKSDLAEQTFKAAVTNCEAAVGTNHPSLVMPLDSLANFYYFAEHRYDLAAPLCGRILQIVENTSPTDEAEVEKRARAVAAVYRAQGEYARAEPFYRQTLDLAEKNNDQVPTCLLAVSGFYHDWGKYDQAESLCQRARAIQEQAAASNTTAEAQMSLAIVWYGLAENYRSWGKFDQAESFYTRSVDLVGKVLGRDSSELARPLAGLAATQAARGKPDRAIALYQQAFTVSENKLPPGDPVVSSVLDDYTALLDKLNRSGEAKIVRQDYQWRTLIYQSQHLQRASDLENAERLASQALELTGNFDAADPRRTKSRVQMAEIYRQQGKLDLAEQTYLNAIAGCEKAGATNNPDLIPPVESLANFYYYTRVRYDQVALLYQRILNILQAAPVLNSTELARWQRNLADVYNLQKQGALAETFYQRALSTVETATNYPAGDKVQYLQALADFYQAAGKYDLAEQPAKRALAIREQALGTDPNPDAQMDVAICCDSLAHIYLAWNKPGQAELFYNRSVPLVEKVAGAESPDLTPRLMGLAAALRAQKKYAEAEAQYKRAVAITEKSIGPEAPELAGVLDQYAVLLDETKKNQDAKDARDWANYVRKQDASRTSN